MHTVIALLVSLPLFATAASRNDWHQFRGPTGDGVSRRADPPVTWAETRNVRWKTAVPGRGYSSPVVTGTRVWLTTAIERGTQKKKVGPDMSFVSEHIALRVLCIDFENGGIVWNKVLFEVEKPDPIHCFNSFATPTPFLAGDRLYCDFGTYGTACVEAGSGRTVWKRQLELDHQAGPGSSPVVHKDLLLLVRDGRDVQYVAALDTETGKTVWKTDRPPVKASSGNMKKSFSTPCIFAFEEKTQMAVPCAQWLASYDPATGRELWRLKHGTNFSIAPRPSFGNGLLYYCIGCGRSQVWAVRPDGEGEITGNRVAWKSKTMVPLMSSPILVGGEIYWVSDAGVAVCADAASGEIVWRERLGGRYKASPVFAADRLYFVNTEGKTSVVAAGRAFKLLAGNALEEAGDTAASPAAVGGSLVIRTGKALYRVTESGTGRTVP